jgi:hypothetical protein
VSEGGTDIYVHAKVMIVDDRFLRVGSANMNKPLDGAGQRMRPDDRRSAREDARLKIADLRTDLMAEHLGVEREEVEKCFGENRLSHRLHRAAAGERAHLVPFAPAKPNKLEKAIATSELLDPEAPNDFRAERSARIAVAAWATLALAFGPFNLNRFHCEDPDSVKV